MLQSYEQVSRYETSVQSDDNKIQASDVMVTSSNMRVAILRILGTVTGSLPFHFHGNDLVPLGGMTVMEPIQLPILCPLKWLGSARFGSVTGAKLGLHPQFLFFSLRCSYLDLTATSLWLCLCHDILPIACSEK